MIERTPDIYCLSNMGLHIAADGRNILIDALNTDRQYPYAGISRDMAQTIIYGRPPCDHIDMMLVSHHHEDHFDADLVARFIREQPHIPVCSSPYVADAVRQRVHEANSIMSMDIHPMRAISFFNRGLNITAVALHHAGSQYADILNLAFIIHGSYPLVFTGDADFSEENMERLAELCPCPSLLVIPFPWFSVKTACQRMWRILHPSRILIMHLPCEKNDHWGWNKSVQTALAREPLAARCSMGMPGTRHFF